MTLSVLESRLFGAVTRGFAFRYGTFAIVFVVMRIKEQNKSDETKVCRNRNICFSEAVTFSY